MTDNGLDRPENFVPLLRGIGLAGYRSFPGWQALEFPTKVTVIAGINNSGKSNVLRFLQNIIPATNANNRVARLQNQDQASRALDTPRGFRSWESLTLGIPLYPGTYGEPEDVFSREGSVRGTGLSAYQEGLISALGKTEPMWVKFRRDGDLLLLADELLDDAMAEWPRWDTHWRQAHYALGGNGTLSQRDVMDRLFKTLDPLKGLPNVVTIPGSRRVESVVDGDSDWLVGRGMIDQLAALQNPPHDMWESSKPRWVAINRFVQNVLGDDEATLNIPHDRSTIQVEMADRVLPLSSLGSGVEQVIVLASGATVTSKTLVCIEEPETNLHPLLQKKLVKYLAEQTDNQYVIATHSPHLIDESRSTAYHVRLTTDGSKVSRARRPRHLVEIFQDLGYRPSDLLQANSVIWVEGPSDRIYMRRWLELVAPELREGLDYSIMFYGGRLLSHLTANEQALEDFINLRRLNQSSMVLIDSDKTSAHQRVNATKLRLQREFEDAAQSGGFAWVTRGFTIENYVAPGVLREAVGRAHPGVELAEWEQWSNPLKTTAGDFRADKIAIAREAARLTDNTHLDELDLRKQIGRVAQFVKAANGMTIAPTETQIESSE